MEQDKQLTTKENRILDINRPSRHKPTSDLRRTWEIVLNGGERVYVTETELEFYLAQKERGATHVMFKDFGVTTNYKYFAKNEEALKIIMLEQEEKVRDTREQEIAQQFTPKERKRNLKAWDRLKKDMIKKGLTKL